jgi:GTPase
MKTVLLLAVHLGVTLVKLARPGGVRAVMAELLVLRHQMMVSNGLRRRARNLSTLDPISARLGKPLHCA